MLKGLTFCLCLAVAAAGSATAQEAGGIAVEPAATAALSGLAQLPAFVFPTPTAADIQGTILPADRSAGHRNMIARVRGVGGFLDGFAFGQPLALSRVPVGPPLVPDFNFVQNFNGPITNGSGNITNFLVARGQGPIAQQVNLCSLVQEGQLSPEQATIKLLCGGGTNSAIGDTDADEDAVQPRR
jgi:hypothetical protein